MTDPQTVEREPDTQVKPVDEVVVDAQSTNDDSGEFDLDSILKEWDKEEPKAEVPDKKEEAVKVDDQNKELLEYVKVQKEREEAALKARAADEFKKTIQSVKGDLKISDKIVSGWLQELAASDARVTKAYVNRDKNPEAWAKVEKNLHLTLRKELNAMPDKATTDTREKIAAAIQNAQSTNYTAEKVKVTDMNDNEFESFKNSLPSS